MRKVVFNGKFQSQKATGVQRVAQALITGLVDKKAHGDEGLSAVDMAIATPAGVEQRVAGIRSAGTSRLKGVPWEQLELPFIAGRDLLVNLCNVGPLSRTGDVLMIHDAQAFISPESYSAAFGLWYRSILPVLARKAARILTVSDYSRQCLADAGVAPLERIEVIHNGVDHILDVVADTSVLGRRGLEGRRYIVAPASVQRHKNLKPLIEATALLRDADVRVVLIGAATRADFAAAGMELSANVVLAGRAPDAEMRALIEGARAFAFPSRTEGFGLPPLEAMLLGTPAIVAPCGALPELCGTAAVMADADQPQAWAEAMTRMLEDDVWRSHYAAAGRLQAQGFGWSAAIDKLAKVLQTTV